MRRDVSRLKRAVLWLSGLAMVAIGITHFADPEPFVRIVPGALPYPLALVYISGFFRDRRRGGPADPGDPASRGLVG